MSGHFYSVFIGKLFKDITHLPEFEKDLKNLLKHFKTLEGNICKISSKPLPTVIINSR